MFGRIKYYAAVVLRAFRQRKILISQFDRILKKQSEQNLIVKFIGYYPEAFEYTDINILRLSSTSKIGKANRLILVKSKYPSSDKESIISLGKNCWTGNSVEINILTGTQVLVKDFTTIQDYCKIIGDVTIEKYCLLAPSVFISSGNHYAERNNPDIIRNQDEYHLASQDLLSKHSKKIHIEEDCWIGFSAFIKAGLYIGRGAVIGANAVITKDVLPYSIMGGVQKRIGSRLQFNPPLKVEAFLKEHKPYFYRGFVHKKQEHHSMQEKRMILGSEGGIVILQKGTLRCFRTSGRAVNFNPTDKIMLSVAYNGEFAFTMQLNIDSYELFQLELNWSQFQSFPLNKKDQVLCLINSYNVFHVTFPDLTFEKSGEETFIEFDYFEEELGEL